LHFYLFFYRFSRKINFKANGHPELLSSSGAGGQGMTPEELRLAMRSAEDETDAAAAAAAEEETAEELKEFTADPGPSAENEDEEGEPEGSKYAPLAAKDVSLNKIQLACIAVLCRLLWSRLCWDASNLIPSQAMPSGQGIILGACSRN
jgi:hypothetical protein